jgi:hypothetical protein
VPVHVREEAHRSPVRPDGARLGEVGVAVVAALHVNVGPQPLDHADRRVVVEKHDMVNAGERGEHHRPVVLGVHRAVRTLEPPYGAVTVQRDDERITQPPGGVEVLNVASVQDVETPIGKNQPLWSYLMRKRLDRPDLVVHGDFVPRLLTVYTSGHSSLTPALPTDITPAK